MREIRIHDDKIILKMLEHCYTIDKYIENMNYTAFSEDLKTVDACISRITQIGEKVARISDRTRESHDEIPWKAIKGMRNVVVHNYDAIDFEEVWKTVKEDIPNLKEILTKLLINDYEYTIEKIEKKLDLQLDTEIKNKKNRGR